MIHLVISAFICCLSVTVVQAATPPQSADLSVTLVASPDPVRQGDPLTYHLTVKNHGPGTARNARVIFFPVYGKFPSPLDVACRVANMNIECAVSELAPGASNSYQWTVSAQGVREISAMSGVSSDADYNDYNNARGQVTRILYRIPTPEERTALTSQPKPGGQSCSRSRAVDMAEKVRLQPTLTPVEINGVWVVALPDGFQDLMPGSISPHYIRVLLTAIDQPEFPDWIKLKRAVFTQGEAQQELFLDRKDHEACGPALPYRMQKNEKLLCADPQQIRFNSSLSIAMHLMFEDNQGYPYEIVDEFCSSTPM